MSFLRPKIGYSQIKFRKSQKIDLDLKKSIIDLDLKTKRGRTNIAIDIVHRPLPLAVPAPLDLARIAAGPEIGKERMTDVADLGKENIEMSISKIGIETTCPCRCRCHQFRQTCQCLQFLVSAEEGSVHDPL